MKLYSCAKCHNLLYFENSVCLNCNSAAGFDAATLSMATLQPGNNNVCTDINDSSRMFRYCANSANGVCNWLVPVNNSSSFCIACQLNRIIPALSNAANVARWKQIEEAKHRLVYSLLRLHLPVAPKKGNEETGIAFDFMEDVNAAQKIMTGHDNGVVTLNINEADEAERVKHKLDLGERYRTLLGHFRHEIGHYYWEIFFKDNETNAAAFRKVFGDERLDYSKALEDYYQHGAPADWNNHFISAYATSHPWEDWAETWAHYLHMIDTLETAYSFGITINPRKASDLQEMQTTINHDPYGMNDFDGIVKMWLPLTFAVNSLNRSMGHQDFYPFIVSGDVIAKLKFIHQQIRQYNKEN